MPTMISKGEEESMRASQLDNGHRRGQLVTAKKLL